MKALAKVYPLLGNIRFLALLLALVMLGFAAHLWIKPTSKPPIQLRFSHKDQISFTVGDASHTLPLSQTLEIHPFESVGQRWGAAAVKVVYISDVIADLVDRNRIQKEPLFGFVQDGQDKEYIVLISGEGELTVSSVDWLLKNASAPQQNGIEIKFPNACSSFDFKIWFSANDTPSPPNGCLSTGRGIDRKCFKSWPNQDLFILNKINSIC